MPYGTEEAMRPVVEVTDKGPFWLQPDPIAAFISALQKYLGANVTGEWNMQTHDLWAAWLTRTPDDLVTEAALTKTVPIWGGDPEGTARAFVKSSAILEEIDAFKSNLGLLYSGRTMEYGEWDTLRSDFMVALSNHIVGAESTVVPASSGATDTALVLAPETTPTTPWYKHPVFYVAVAGAVVTGLLVWATRPAKPSKE